jgi:predicted DNA-binding transcriptional regulator YafY
MFVTVRKTARLFAIAEHLRGRRSGITAEQLAERFGVTVRTIYRDLDALRDAELPLHAERGRGGGYALDRAYTLPPVNFNAREAAVLLAVGRYMTEMRLLPFTDTLDAALDKVRAALGGSAQHELAQRLSTLKFLGVPARASRPEVRRALEQAWFENRPLKIWYLDGSFVQTERTVKVRSVIMERSETLLNCDDLEKSAERQFKLDRIQRALVV